SGFVRWRQEEDRVGSRQERPGDAMRKLIATAAIACVGAAVLLGQTGTAVQSQTPASPTAAAVAGHRPLQPAQAGDAKTYRAFVNKYCVGCHNSRNAQPSSEPVDLEKA